MCLLEEESNVDLSSEILDEFVRVANEAADAAADVVRKYYRKPHLIQTFDKRDEDGCIVEEATNADRDAEAAMIPIIQRNFPHHLVLGEESGWTIPELRDDDYVWVLDPIDGTSSFKDGAPLFGTLIALLYKNKPILGIIDQPILRERWVGVKGRKTIINGDIAQTRPCENLSQAKLYASQPEHYSDEEKEHLDRLTNKAKEFIYGADCYYYGLLASGRIDGIVQSFLQPYDFLAFIPIIEGAGGIITDWAGQKLKWEASPKSIGPSYYRIIVAGDERVHQDAIEYLIRATDNVK